MKKFNLSLTTSLILLVFSVNSFTAVTGELILHPINLNGNSTFNLHVYKESDYAWLWDETNSKVIFVDDYNHTWNDLEIRL